MQELHDFDPSSLFDQDVPEPVRPSSKESMECKFFSMSSPRQVRADLPPPAFDVDVADLEAKAFGRRTVDETRRLFESHPAFSIVTSYEVSGYSTSPC